MPCLSVDGGRLWFTSNRAGGRDPSGRAGVHREDLWSCERLPGGDWSPALPLPGALNTRLSEGSASFSADGGLLVFSACDRPGGPGGCDLFLARPAPGGWSAGEALTAVNSPAWDSQPALSALGDALIFASDRPGGLGGSDLWLSRRDDQGNFSPPENLADLNTSGNEAGPFLHLDGRSLYFSSDGREGLGGLDLFLSRMGDDGHWGMPVNLGPPLSTQFPDLGLSVAGDGRQAIFASRREGRPDLDLYETRLPDCCPAQPSWLLSGRTIETGSGRPLPARLRLEPFGALASALPAVAQADSLGRFAFVLARGEFQVFAEAPGHLFACALLRAGAPSVEGAEPDGLLPVGGPTDADTLLLCLDPFSPGAHLSLAPLRFAFNQSGIQPESLPLLGQVRDLLAARPEARIELRGHTDDVGGDRHNQELSLKRAEAVKRWLVEAGIDAGRIATVGVGDREPLDRSGGEAARAANRRTEMWLR